MFVYSQNWRKAFAKYGVTQADAERFQHTFSAFDDDCKDKDGDGDGEEDQGGARPFPLGY